MSTPNFPPRFIEGEDVRLKTALKQVDGSNTIPAGTTGYVEAFQADGRYLVRLHGSYSSYCVIADESELEEVKRLERQTTLALGTGVQGTIARIAMRQGGVLSAFLTLEGRHESFVVHAQNFEQEQTMLLTRPGDKVRFVITEEDENRPRGNAFENLFVN